VSESEKHVTIERASEVWAEDDADAPRVTNQAEAEALLATVIGGLNDGHARYPVPELNAVLDWMRERPFIYVKVEGGLAEVYGDVDRVDTVQIDFDVSESTDSAIEELDSMIEDAERIPDRLAVLPHDDPGWIDKAGILTSLRDDLAEHLTSLHGEVFVNEEGIVPRCDICDGPQLVEGDDWNGDTGNHRSCESDRLIRLVVPSQ